MMQFENKVIDLRANLKTTNNEIISIFIKINF